MKNCKYKRLKRALSMSVLFVLSIGITTNAGQNQEEKAEKNTGSITIHLEDTSEKISKKGVTFAYEKVAELKDGSLKMLEEYQDETDLNTIETTEQLREISEALQGKIQQPDGQITTDEQGQASTGKLETGAYLFYVTDKAEYENIVPLVISIPTYNDATNEMEFDITAIPKHFPEEKESPVAPQTNFNSRVEPYILIGGLLIVIGVITLISSKDKKK